MRDFSIVSFAVDPARLAALMPHTFEPERFTLDDGSTVALVSAVPFRVASLTLGVRIPMNYVQVNYRAYIWRHDERGVWFFGSTVSTPAVALPRALLGLPWYRVESTLRASWESGRCADYAMHARGDWGSADFACVGSGAPVGRLDGFPDKQETLAVLGSPLSGFFLRPNGRLFELRVSHPTLEPQIGTARVASFSVFERLGLIEPDTAPHSILLQQSTDFTIVKPALSLR
jgi:hypothetical protein